MSSSPSRLKREDCKRTLHDSVFFKWEILIGSSDWEDYSLGKDGVQRYRIHNLPNSSSCPGLYELGLAAVPTEGPRVQKQDLENIIVVYLGQTNNVRTRLQRYGRVGAHLDSGKLVSSENEDDSPGLFKEIFSKGYSIMFRWVPMIDKKKAEKTEAELLVVFDYAWNKCGNGSLRREEILSKLHSKPTSPIHPLIKRLQPWNYPSLGSKTGINIDSSAPLNDQKGFFLPQVLKFGKSQLRFIYGNNSLDEDQDICGVAMGNGSICKHVPIRGRRRCEEHKGKKIIGTAPVLKENTIICGIVLEDGSPCAQLPTYGNKRCEMHKGQKVCKPGSKIKPHIKLPDQFKNSYWECQPQVEDEKAFTESNNICGVVSDGCVCRGKPVPGRKRCEEHKGLRITVKLSVTSEESSERKEMPFVCGVGMGNGSICRRSPVPGRKRCESHKGRRVS